MKSSNLAYPETPFGNPGQSTGPDTPTVAALAVTASGTGLVYAPFEAHRPHDLESAPQQFAFGYEVLRVDEVGPEAFAVALDRRMAECDLYAEVITGHDMASMLEPLCTAAGERGQLACLKKLTTLWPNRHKPGASGRGTSRLVDTAFDLDVSAADLGRTCAAAKLSSAYLGPARDTWRRPVTAAFASAVLTARSLGWCSWRALDIDPLVAESAWEQQL
ncbi:MULTISPECIES: hypothetical protein [Nocardia]|uniref:hypothetical protein n=1 Tax=Nocardia TaxID=1817 RepID=UPI0024546E34|nr:MULTISPECIES: hypothetical protein [Nocardia]